MKNKVVDIYIDHLNAFNALLLIIRFPRSIIHYIDASRSGLFILRLTQGWVKSQHMHFRMIDIRDEQQALIRLRLQFIDINNFAQECLVNSEAYEVHKAIMSPERGENLLRTLYVLHVFAFKAKQTKAKFWISHQRYHQWLRKYVAKEFSGQELYFYFPLFLLKHLLKRLKLNLCVRSLYYRCIDWRRPKLSAPIFDVKGSEGDTRVMIEYYGHLNLGEKPVNADMFFVKDAAIAPADVLVSFNINYDPINQQKKDFLTEHQFKSIALCPGACGDSGVSLYAPVIPAHFFNPKLLVSEYWRKLFIETHTKIHVTWFKYDTQHIAITHAMRAVGGVAMIYQRAIEDMPSATLRTETDVMFGFSKQSAAIENLSGSHIPNYVITGYLGDHRINALKPLASKVRQEMMNSGAMKILAFFDENSKDDDRWHTGHDMMRSNYRFLLERVLDTPWLGVVFKPKIPTSLRKRLGSVSSLLEQAIATGRCRIFDEGGLIASYPPVAAALVSDIAIHGHLCAATAGVEAALAGKPTLLLDREGWPHSSLHRLGKNKVVFTEWSTLFDACIHHWGNPGQFQELGQWGDALNEFDPYRDGKASLRASEFIGDVYKALKNNETKEEAIKKACKAFAKKWGQDKILRINC